MIFLPINKWMQLRVLRLSYKYKLSHLSSTLPAVNIFENIYRQKKEGDKVVVSNGHSSLGLYSVIESYSLKKGIKAEALLLKNGIHPNRDLNDDIYCSTGSLGLGLPIAVGMALGSKNHVFCTISDGEMSEGSIWEALKFLGDNNVQNITVVVQLNGYGAYSQIDIQKLKNRALSFYDKIIFMYTDTKFLGTEDGLEYHYKVMDEELYNKMEKVIYESRIQTLIV